VSDSSAQGKLTPEQRDDLTQRGFTRRGILRVMALASAGATLPFTCERAFAQLSNLKGPLPANAVKINANEFPEGPSEQALKALLDVSRRGNRYQYSETSDLVSTAAKLEGLAVENFEAYPGSSIALQHAVIAFTSPERGLVTVEPGYEAAVEAATFIGAPVTRVPLRADASHDIDAMLAAASAKPTGLFYVCNPNNPTGTVTPRADIEKLIANKPEGSVVLLDEAYIHFSDEPPGTDLVRDGKDVVLLRTFSKIYGMAGLRAGYSIGRKDLLVRAAAYKSGAMPVTSMAAAHAMLNEPELVAARKKGNTERREALFRFLDRHGYAYTPSVSNKLMVDVRMPTVQMIDALAKRDVFVGRPWPVWPNHVRVSIGSPEDMKRFEAAFLDVVATTKAPA
jgi:histidinol-phosphate/aromatic aminotransferase/cobyric acid decarboxylase-like protein